MTLLPLLLLLPNAGAPAPDDAAPAVRIRVDRPDEVLASFLRLFDGAPAPNPAAALASWKRATGGTKTLGKGPEALIAAGNPGMVRELRSLDRAEVSIDLEPGTGRPRWNAVIPGDADHVVAAFGTSMALTDGAPEPPLGPLAVDRLGPPGSALLGQAGGLVVVGSDRDQLRRGLDRSRARPTDPPPAPGVTATFTPASLGVGGPLGRKRLVEAMGGLGIRRVDVTATIEDRAFRMDIVGLADATVPPAGSVDATWLDLAPADRVAAVVAVAIDATPAGLDRIFALVDRVEKADPTRAKVAPARTRLNLLALGAGLKPEVELWPALRGLSAALVTRPDRSVAGGIVALHAVDEPAAKRIATSVLPKLARAARLPGGDPTRLGIVAGRPLAVEARESRVLLRWGEPADLIGGPAAVGSSPVPREAWSGGPPSRVALVWPGRLPGVAGPGTPLRAGLDAMPPVAWWGRTDGRSTRDRLRAGGLQDAVRAFLAKVPMTPPPADDAGPAPR